MTSLTAPQRLVLENYIAEILNDKNDIVLINENKKASAAKWWLAGGGAVLWGATCWSRGTVWHNFIQEIIVAGGAEAGIIYGLHKGKRMVVLTGFAITAAWDNAPWLVDNVPGLEPMANILNLLPEHERRHVGWTLASVLVPVGAEFVVARRGDIWDTAKGAPAVIRKEFSGSGGARQKLGNILKKLNRMIEGDPLKTLGYVNSAKFADDLELAFKEFDDLTKGNGGGTTGFPPPQHYIDKWSRSIAKILLTNVEQRAIVSWAWVKTLRSQAFRARGGNHPIVVGAIEAKRKLAAVMNRLLELSTDEWKILARANPRHRKEISMRELGTPGEASRWSGNVQDQELTILGTGDKLVYLELRPVGTLSSNEVKLIDQPGWTGVHKKADGSINRELSGKDVEVLDAAGNPVLEPVEVLDAAGNPILDASGDPVVDMVPKMKWVETDPSPVQVKWRPSAMAGEVNDPRSADFSRLGFEWISSGAPYPAQPMTLDGRTILVARKDDVFTAHAGMATPDGTGILKSALGTPSGLSGLSLAAWHIAKARPLEFEGDADEHPLLLTPEDAAAYAATQAEIDAGVEEGERSSESITGCGVEDSIITSLFSKITNIFGGDDDEQEQDTTSTPTEEPEASQQPEVQPEAQPQTPGSEPEVDPNDPFANIKDL